MNLLVCLDIESSSAKSETGTLHCHYCQAQIQVSGQKMKGHEIWSATTTHQQTSNHVPLILAFKMALRMPFRMTFQTWDFREDFEGDFEGY